jgi:hypothetical protein
MQGRGLYPAVKYLLNGKMSVRGQGPPLGPKTEVF